MSPFLLGFFFTADALKSIIPVVDTLTQAGTQPEGTVAISTPTFISTLTLVVTIIAVAVAFVGIVGALFSFWLFRAAIQAQKEAQEAVAEMKKKRDKFNDEMIRTEGDINSHMLAMRQSASAFHPSGAFLSEEIKGILKDLELEKCACAETIEALVEKLSSAFLANAEFGIQIQKLYVGKKDEVLASIMYLSQKPSRYALSLLRERLDFEKKLPKSDPDLIEALVKTISEMERILESSSSETGDQGQ